MDMTFVFLVVMGFLTCVLVAGLFQTLTVVLTRRARENWSSRK